jgi:hypothetical protein
MTVAAYELRVLLIGSDAILAYEADALTADFFLNALNAFDALR